MMDGGSNGQILAALGGLLIGGLLSFALANRFLAKRNAAHLRKAKDQFVALTSHYLLTPISIIQGALAILQESESRLTTEDRQKQYFNIEKGQQRLWILAEEFILVSQLEQGMLQLKIETGNMADLVVSSMAAVDIFAREKNVKLTFQDDTKALREARFDQRRCRQAVVAILDNAIKFSPEGKTVATKLRIEKNMFTIEVNDAGEGMSDEAVRQVAQKFARGNSSYTFDHEGIGLGLYTANAIVREHGGELKIESTKGTGTTVKIRFPGA